MTKSYAVEYEMSTRIDTPTTTTLLAIPEVEDAITGVIVWEGVTRSDLDHALRMTQKGWPMSPRVTIRVVGRNGAVYFGTKPKALIGLRAGSVVAFKAASVTVSRDGTTTFFKRPSRAKHLGSLAEGTGFLPA